MLQQDVRHTFGQWCDENSVAIVSYWPLMKGLLAGKIRRDFQFDPADKRLKYEIFQAPYFEKAQLVIDQLEVVAADLGCTVAQLVIAWTIVQPGITVALAGAKRDWQIAETAEAMQIHLPDSICGQIDQIAADFMATTKMN
jgi:aryl-alcohol dehydrogenase-like predicted oxidoreductase